MGIPEARVHAPRRRTPSPPRVPVSFHVRSSARPARRPGVALLVACAALLLGSCSSSPTATDSPSASGDLAAQAAAYAALAPQDQEAQLRTISTDLEHQLLTLSGLEKELGGPAKATAAYDAMTAAMVARAAAIRSAGYVGKFGGLARADDTPSLGGMMFASLMIGGLSAEAVTSATNDAKPGGKPLHDERNDGKGGNTSSMTLDGTVGTAAMDWTMTTTANGVEGKLRTKITVNPCPDATGTFTAKLSMAMSATSSGGRVGSNSTIDIDITGHVDDDAHVTSYEVITHSQAAEFGSGDNHWAEVTDTSTTVGDKLTGYTRVAGRTSGNVPAKFADQWGDWGMITAMMMVPKVVGAAQKAWESGRCVALVPTTSPDKRSGLEPSSTVTITAAPRSKIDGGPVGGTVTANLTGDASVDPSGSKVKADATFTYVAPGEKDKSASVALEARSKRGVAKASVDFDTKPGSYKVTGTMPSVPSGTTFTGTICKPDKPFTVQTTGDMVGTASFTPKSATAGKVTFTGKVGNAPFAMGGSGTYTLAAPEGSGTGTLAISWKLTIKIPFVGDQTRSGPATLTLTPTSAC